MRNIKPSNSGKSKIYRLFANVFAVEPTEEFLRLLEQEENKDLFNSFGIDPLSDIKTLSLAEKIEALSIEYAKLFLVPGTTASPRESIQLGEERLWGESTVKVNNIFGRFGFKLDDSFKDTPDHLSAELMFLAELSDLESEYSQKDLLESNEGVRRVKRDFLKEHLLKWFSGFQEKINRSADISYYKEMVRLLGLFLADEWDELKKIKEEIDV